MSWINFNDLIMKVRAQRFNNSVATTPRNLDRLSDRSDSFFWGNRENVIESISAIMQFPFHVRYSEAGWLKALGKATTTEVYADTQAYRIAYDSSYVTLGSVFINRKYNNFLDYKEYTDLKVYLPYVGFVDIDINECLSKWLNFRLYIDYFTGMGLYIIGVSDDEIIHESAPYIDNFELENFRIIAIKECKLSTDIPFGSSNMAEQQRNLLLNSTKAIASLGASLYTGTPLTGTAGQGAVTKKVVTMRRVKDKDDPSGYSMQTYQTRKTTTYPHTTKRDVRDYVGSTVSSTINDTASIIQNFRPTVDSDRPSSSNLMIAISTNIQIVIYRPKVVYQVGTFTHLYGKPYGEVDKLKNLHGYTKIADIHLGATHFGTATQEEMAMLKEELLNGVYLP